MQQCNDDKAKSVANTATANKFKWCITEQLEITFKYIPGNVNKSDEEEIYGLIQRKLHEFIAILQLKANSTFIF